MMPATPTTPIYEPHSLRSAKTVATKVSN